MDRAGNLFREDVADLLRGALGTALSSTPRDDVSGGNESMRALRAGHGRQPLSGVNSMLALDAADGTEVDVFEGLSHGAGVASVDQRTVERANLRVGGSRPRATRSLSRTASMMSV